MNNIIANIRTQLQKLKCRIANLSNRVTYIEDNCCNGGGSIEQDNIFRVVEVSLTELGLTTDATESEIQIALANYIESLNINVEDDEVYVWQVTGYTSEDSGGIQTIIAGDNITIDNTDPQNPIISSTGGGGGASSFTELSDAPNSYSGQANKAVFVKDDETGVEFRDVLKPMESNSSIISLNNPLGNFVSGTLTTDISFQDFKLGGLARVVHQGSTPTFLSNSTTNVLIGEYDELKFNVMEIRCVDSVNNIIDVKIYNIDSVAETLMPPSEFEYIIEE